MSHKIHFGATTQPLFPSLESHFSQIVISMLLFLFLSCCISSLGKGCTAVASINIERYSYPIKPIVSFLSSKTKILQVPYHTHICRCWLSLHSLSSKRKTQIHTHIRQSWHGSLSSNTNISGMHTPLPALTLEYAISSALYDLAVIMPIHGP